MQFSGTPSAPADIQVRRPKRRRWITAGLAVVCIATASAAGALVLVDTATRDEGDYLGVMWWYDELALNTGSPNDDNTALGFEAPSILVGAAASLTTDPDSEASEESRVSLLAQFGDGIMNPAGLSAVTASTVNFNQPPLAPGGGPVTYDLGQAGTTMTLTVDFHGEHSASLRPENLDSFRVAFHAADGSFFNAYLDPDWENDDWWDGYYVYKFPGMTLPVFVYGPFEFGFHFDFEWNVANAGTYVVENHAVGIMTSFEFPDDEEGSADISMSSVFRILK